MKPKTKDQRYRTKDEGRSPSSLVLGCLALVLYLLLPGCRSCEHVEAELRRREAEVCELRDELERSQALNEALRRELCQRSHTSSSASDATTPPASPSGRPVAVALPNTIKEIVLTRQTGGLNADHEPGDEALQVVVEPRDPDGHALKVPGQLTVTVLEIVPEGLKKPLSTWELDSDQLRRCWKSGLFGSGFYVVLPWKCPPRTEKLRVIVQFTLPDGRLFEADRDITVRLLPLVQRSAPVSGSVISDGTETLPLPHQVEKPNVSWSEAVRLLRPEVLNQPQVQP